MGTTSPLVIPAKAGIQGRRLRRLPWIPAFAGMTEEGKASLTSERHLIAAFELQDLPRLVRRCDLEGESL